MGRSRVGRRPAGVNCKGKGPRTDVTGRTHLYRSTMPAEYMHGITQGPFVQVQRTGAQSERNTLRRAALVARAWLRRRHGNSASGHISFSFHDGAMFCPTIGYGIDVLKNLEGKK